MGKRDRRVPNGCHESEVWRMITVLAIIAVVALAINAIGAMML